jgi:large subunit ribosomal protein L21
VEKVGAGSDGQVEFPVLAVSGDGGQVVRQADARVIGQVVEGGRGPKLLVFHYKRKKQYKKLRGHRQAFTAVRITEIACGGQSFKAPEAPKKEVQPRKVKEVKAEAPAAEAKPAKAPAKKKAAAPKKAAKKTSGKRK